MYDYTNITARTIPEAHRRLVYRVWNFGDELVDQRNDAIRELLNVVVRINTDDCSHVPGFERMDKDFADALVNEEKALEYGKRFVYAYGDRLHFEDQLKNLIELLRTNPESRRAYIPIYQPKDNAKYGPEDVPCWTSLQFLIRNNKLHMTDYFRSNDIFLAMPSDLYGARYLQHYIAKSLGVDVGTFTHVIGSAHIRMTDEDAVKAFLKV